MAAQKAAEGAAADAVLGGGFAEAATSTDAQSESAADNILGLGGSTSETAAR